MTSDSTVTPTKSAPQQRTCIVVARHGERMDYVMRDAGLNWVQSSNTPWDPPLTSEGFGHGRWLGEQVQQVLSKRGLAPIEAVYSSPFCRCRQTARAALVDGGLASKELQKIRVEDGLAESLNESWYRSWCLPESNGTWGYPHNTTVDKDDVHVRAKSPVQSILAECRKSDNERAGSRIDLDYESVHQVRTPYQWGNFESRAEQRERMFSVIQELAKEHAGGSVLLVSHGGPVTHLYERLTGNHWSVHGESSYGCYSVYVQTLGDEEWEPLVVNESASKTSESHVNQVRFWA